MTKYLASAMLTLAAITLALSFVSAVPSIESYDISASSISAAQSITVTGNAQAQGDCITAHRFFIVGSQGGVWTNVSCAQSVSLNDVVPTADNPRSFYRNPGAYIARWEIVDSSGHTTTKDIVIRVGTPDSGVSPTITSFSAPSSIVQGERIIVSGTASAGSSCIVANRFYVVGSQGGVWTTNNCEQSVTLNGNEPTLTNPRSFYHGAGSYTLRWEVLGADGFTSYTERSFNLDEESSDDGDSGNPNPADTTPPSPVSSLILVSVNSTSATWTWTNPSSDFHSVLVYINGINVMNTSSNTFTAFSLLPSTTYNITLYTRDASGNVNTAGVSYSVTTLASPSSGSSSDDGGSSHNRNSGFRYIDSEDESEQDMPPATAVKKGTSPISLSSDESESSSVLSSGGSENALLAMLVSCAVLLMLLVSVIRIRSRRK